MGCDLAYVFCTPAAAPVIKGYSPELIVLPDLIDTEESSKVSAQYLVWHAHKRSARCERQA